MLNNEELDLISNLINLLRPIVLITEKLCAESVPTMSSTFPIIMNLVNNILSKSTEGPVMNMCINLKAEIQNRFLNNSDLGVFMSLASLLDPRFKSLSFLARDQQQEAHSMLIERIAAFTTSVSTIAPVAACSKTNDTLELLFGPTLARSQETTSSPLIEFERYLAESSPSLDSDSLNWWRANANRFPSLASMARTYLCIPATSVPCERIFSEIGLVIRKNRSRLSPKIAEALIHLHHKYSTN